MRPFGLSAALFVLALLGCNAQPAWQELSLPADSVRVRMPSKWKEEPVQGGVGRMYQTVHGGTEYLLGVHEADVGNLPADVVRKTLEEVRLRMVGALPGGKVTDESETQLEGRQGIAFKAHGSNGEVVQAKAFLGGGRLIIIMVDYRQVPRSQANVDKFFDSLTFDLSATSTTPAGTNAAPPVPPPSAETPPAAAPPPVVLQQPPAESNSSPPPPAKSAPKSDERVAWRYTNAPKVFNDQKSFNGVFRKEAGNAWVDDTDAGPLNLIEVGRSDDFIELVRPGTNFRMRLYDDRSEYSFNGVNWKDMYPGQWE